MKTSDPMNEKDMDKNYAVKSLEKLENKGKMKYKCYKNISC